MSETRVGASGWRRRALLGLLSLMSLSAPVVIAVRSDATAADVVTLLPASSHALALGAAGADFLCRALRLSLLADAAGDRLRPWPALRSQLGAEAAGFVTPARSGAEPAKVWLLSRDGLGLDSIGAVLVGEILAEVAVLAIVAGTMIVLHPPVAGAAGATFSYAAMGVGGSALAVLVARLPRGGPPGLWDRLGVGEDRWRRVRALARLFLARLRRLREAGTGVVGAILATTAVHIAGRLAVLPALAGGAGFEAPLPWLVAWPMLLLYGGALVPVPGGGGAIELGFAAALGSTLSAEALAPALVWWRVYTHYLAAALGAIVLSASFLRHGRPAPASGKETP